MELSKTPKQILSILKDWQKDQPGRVFISHNHIANIIGVCRITVLRWLKFLRKIGLVWWRGHLRSNNTRGTNEYFLSNEVYKININDNYKPSKKTNITHKSKCYSIIGNTIVKLSQSLAPQPGNHKNEGQIGENMPIDLNEARIFLETWQDDEIKFQTFHENPNLPRKYGPQILTGTFQDCAKELELLNRAGHGIYCTANKCEGKRKTENITKVRGYVLDLDGSSTTKIDKFIEFVPATMIVETSPGKFQFWFKGKDCPLHNFKEIQQGLAKRFGGDRKVCDLPRVFRIPGFYHQKNEPFRSTLVHSDKTKVYDYRKLRKYFLRIEKKKAYTGNSTFDGQIYGAPQGERNNRLFKLICSMIGRRINYQSCYNAVVEFASRCTPPLPEEEAVYTFKQAWSRYAS